MKSFVIGKNDSGQRLDKFIAKTAYLLPAGLMYKYIRLKRIKLNGKRAEISARLREGDVVDMYINDEFFEAPQRRYDFMNAPADVDVVYEDGNILIADKKPGLMVHSGSGEWTADTLISRVQHYLYKKGEYDPAAENSFAPSLANRIDRNTGGLVIVVKNAEALRIMNEKIKKREIKKYYYCIVHGKMNKRSDTLTAYLTKDESKSRVFISDRPCAGAKTIVTKYTVIKEKPNMSLLEIELITGRTHQIRAHMAFVGHPLIGDGKYGANKQNRGTGYHYQALYSHRLRFCFTEDGGALDYLNGKEFSADKIWFMKEFE